jgi:hypothetical protein
MINFAVWAWPQFVWIGFALFGLFTHMMFDGTPKTSENYSAGKAICATVLGFLLLMFGGFFK